MHKKSTMLIINLSYHCNNNCIFCSVDTHTVKKYIMPMKFNRVKELFEQYSNNRDNYIQLAGGEPTLYHRFDEVLDLIRKSAAQCMLRTNGRFFSDFEYSATLLDNIKLAIVIPFFGTSGKEFNLLAGSDKSFDETVRGIDNIYKIKRNINSGISMALTLYFCKSTLDVNPDIAEMIMERWPEIDALECSFIKIASPVSVKNRDLLAISLDELHDSLNNTLRKIHEREISFAVDFNSLPICLIDDEFLYMIDNNWTMGLTSVITEFYFSDGRRHRETDSAVIKQDPLTCCMDSLDEESATGDPELMNFCDSCILNTMCSYRFAPAKLRKNSEIFKKIIAFNSIETLYKIKGITLDCQFDMEIKN